MYRRNSLSRMSVVFCIYIYINDYKVYSNNNQVDKSHCQ